MVIYDTTLGEISFWLSFDDESILSAFTDIFRTARELAQRRRLTGELEVAMLPMTVPCIPSREEAPRPSSHADNDPRTTVIRPVIRPAWLM